MVKYHLKRLAAPKTWNIARKKSKFITRPFPSSLGMKYSMPLGVWLKEILNIAKDRNEVFYLIKERKVLVNQRPAYSYKSPVGLFDVISFPQLEKHYRVVLNKRGKLTLVEIPKEEANLKLLKLNNKTLIKRGKLQLNFNDGTNVLSDVNAKVGDSFLFDLSKKELKGRLPLEEGSLVYIIAGANIGNLAEVKEIIQSKVKVKLSDDSLVDLPKANLIVVGKDKPVLTI